MDLQVLANLFATTYNPDPNIQKAGELQIRTIGAQEGVLAAILQIIASDGVDLATRQACSVYLKNRVRTSYRVDAPATRPERPPIAPSDRDAVKSHILRLLAVSPSRAITVQLAATLKDVIARDFPDRWPDLLDSVTALLTSGDIREVGAGCVAALECVRAFRYMQGKVQVRLRIIVEKLFPTLVAVAGNMMSAPPSSAQEIPSMLHLILKTYRASTIVDLSPHQQTQESIVPWGRLFFQVIKLQLPADVVPKDEEERERCEWWKVKKWAYATLGRLFNRFGNPSQLPTPMQKEYGEFAKHFVNIFVPEIIQTYFEQVDLYVTKVAWLSKKCQYQIFQFFTACVKPKSTWVLLRPRVESLVTNFVFPHLCFTQTNQEVWDSDPVEYLRTSNNEYEGVSSPVSGATSFLIALASVRTKIAFLPILKLVHQVLDSNAPPPQKFGALKITAVLGPHIMRHPEVKGGMEHFLMQYVLPAFNSDKPYMRAIACEVVGTVVKDHLEWKDPENLVKHSNAVGNAMDDTEIPVRVQAAIALTQMVTSYEEVRTIVSPRVGEVIRRLLQLSEETDVDLLNGSMSEMVEQFQDKLIPVATELTRCLCDSYLRLARDGMAQLTESNLDNVDFETLFEADDDKLYGALSVVGTISTIVSAVDSNHEILSQVQEVIIPIVRFTLENKLVNLFDEVYGLVDSMTFRLGSISPNLWPVFELTCSLFNTEAAGFLDEMLPSLDNFISYGSDVFKARPDYVQKVLDIYDMAMTGEDFGDADRVNGCRLAECVLLNLAGHVDEHVPKIIQVAIDHIDGGHTYAFKLSNLIVLINAIFYNAAASLHLMERHKPGAARLFFDKWFKAINTENKLPRVHDKKLSLLALSKLLEMDGSMIPANLQEGWFGIVSGALVIFKSFPQAVTKRKALEQSLAEDSNDGDEDDVGYLNLEGEDDEDVWDEDSMYLEMLANESARLRARSEKAELGEDVDDDEDESEIEEELTFFSVIDAINPYTTFKDALTTFQIKNPALYQTATTVLSVEQQTVLMEVMTLAETQQALQQATQ